MQEAAKAVSAQCAVLVATGDERLDGSAALHSEICSKLRLVEHKQSQRVHSRV
jgi:hypothetical protein